MSNLEGRTVFQRTQTWSFYGTFLQWFWVRLSASMTFVYSSNHRSGCQPSRPRESSSVYLSIGCVDGPYVIKICSFDQSPGHAHRDDWWSHRDVWCQDDDYAYERTLADITFYRLPYRPSKRRIIYCLIGSSCSATESQKENSQRFVKEKFPQWEVGLPFVYMCNFPLIIAVHSNHYQRIRIGCNEVARDHLHCRWQAPPLQIFSDGR